MTTPSGQLLRTLSGGVSPCSPESADRPRSDDAGPLNFTAMLEQARESIIYSDLPVRVPVGLSPPLDEAARAGLSRATDRAEAEGIDRALILLADRSFRVDVRSRRVIDAPDARLAAVGGIDGFVLGATDANAAAIAPLPTGPAWRVRNASLTDALAGVRQHGP